jgi:aminoglycoside 6'-N-acetyltransferase
VRPATEADAPLLAAWHADPEVSRYWDDETFTVAEMRDRIARDDVDAWIVEAGGEPIGYLQSWREGATGGLDGFLIPRARGEGLMPDAARTLATALDWPEVTVDPYVWNDRAIRAWEKAGFVEVSRHPPDDEHSADWILMRFAATLSP